MSFVAVLLAEGFEEVEAVTPVDFLRRAGVDVGVVGIDCLTVVGSRGITIQADMLIKDIDPDAVVLPGGMPGAENLAASKAVRRVCSTVHARGGLIAAICAAPAVALDAFGLLNGRNYTCYPGFENKTSSGVFVAQNVVRDGNLITSRGPGTAAEFAIALIEYLVGPNEADRIAQDVLMRIP